MARTRGFDEGQVVAAVVDQFRDVGYAASSLDDLMRVSGLGKGSIYAAFGNKRDLFLRAFDTYCTNVTEALRSALDGPDETAHLRLVAALEASAGPQDTSLHRACFLARGTAELAQHDPDVASRARATFEALAEALATCVRQAQSAGELGAHRDARALSSFLLSVMRGNEALSEARVSPVVLHDAVDVALAGIGLAESRSCGRAANR